MDNKLKKFSDNFEKVLKSYSKVQSPQNNISKLMKYVTAYPRTAKKSNLMEQAIKAENSLFTAQVLVPYFLSQNWYILALEKRISKLEKNKK